MDHRASNDGMIRNNKLEKTWYEVVVVEVLSKHLFGGGDENHRRPQSG
jgi:hypothetical protein